MKRFIWHSHSVPLMALTVLSAGVNFLPLKLMLGVHFLFGGILALLVLILYGRVPGILAAAVCYLPSLLHWGHPYALLIFVAEAAFLGWLCKGRMQRSLVLIDIAYWLCIGIPLVWICYGKISGLEPLAITLVMFKLSINGLFNTLAAALIHSLSVNRSVPRQSTSPELRVPLRHILFRIMLAFVLVSSLLQLTLDNRRLMSMQEEGVAGKLQHVLEKIDISIQTPADVSSYMQVLRAFSGRDSEIGYMMTDAATGEVIYTANALQVAPSLQQDFHAAMRQAEQDKLSLWMGDDPQATQFKTYKNSLYYIQHPLQADSRYLITVQLCAATYWDNLFKEEIQGFTIVACLILATALLSLPISRRLTRPLSELAATTTGILKRIDTDHKIKLPSSYIQEIEALSGNFITVADALQAYLQQLKHHNQRLEQSVAERTSELDHTRSMLSSILSSMRDVVWSLSIRGKKLQYMNHACEAVTGIPMHVFYEQPAVFGKLLHPEDRLAVLKAYRRLLRTGTALVQFRIIKPSGEIGWLQTRAWIVQEEGLQNRIDGITTDVTESRLAGDALKQSEEQYRSVVNNVKEVIFQIDNAGLWTFLNPSWTEISGFSQEESLGTHVLQYIHREDHGHCHRMFSRLIDGRNDFGHHEVRCLTKDGGVRWIDVYARLTLDADGVMLGISGTLNDVTARIQAEREIEQQARELLQLSRELVSEKMEIEAQRNINRSILETTREGMMLCGADGVIQFANDRMKAYFRLDLVQDSNVLHFFQRRSGQFMEPFEPLLEDIVAFLKDPEQASFYRRLAYKDSLETVYYELYVSPVTDGYSDSGDGYLFVFRDRTEEEKRELMKDHLISCLSHELRTPLTSILGYMEILLNRVLPSDRTQTYLATVFRESQRLSRLVDDFLDLQRMELGNQKYYFVPVHIPRFISELAKEWSMQERASISLQLPDSDDVYVYVDTDRIKQVLDNLIGNAIKYSPGVAMIELTVRAQNGIVAVDVTDAGLGIPDEDKEKLFEKFYRVDHQDRRRIGGSGLGLAIAREIMEAHQGEITFTSTYGSGSTFTVWLQEYVVPRTDGAVVLIEQDEEEAKRLEDLLTRSGSPCLRFHSFEEALLAMRHSISNHRSSGLPQNGETGSLPLLCVADLIAGGVMNGWEFLAELASDPHLKTVSTLFTSVIELGASHRGTDLKRWVHKPLSAERLAAAAWHMRTRAEAPVLQEAGDTVYVFPQQDQALLIAQLSKLGLDADEVSSTSDCVWIRRHPA